MPEFATISLPQVPHILAPDGSEVRVLLAGRHGSMAHFRLRAGQVARAVRHRTVEEIWYVLSGRGEMWRSRAGRAENTVLTAGLCLTIPAGTVFQFRASDSEQLDAVAVTMPPWPGEDEAEICPGPWPPNLGP